MAEKKERMFAFAWVGSILQVQRFADKATLGQFALSKLPPEMVAACTDYGFKQKLADSASDAKTPADKLDAMEAIYERMLAGHFSLEREGGTRTTPLWVQALAERKGASVSAVQKALSAYSDEQKQKIRDREDIKAIVKRLESEQDGIELDDMLE